MSVEQRTDQILDAVERLLGRGGISAVTMRAVAEEAGVSLRLVQYYGSSKDDLLSAALERLSSRSVDAWTGEATPDSVRECLVSFMLAALPTDDASRALHRVGVSREVLAITGHPAAATAYRLHLTRIQNLIVDQCLRADPAVSPSRAAELAAQAMSLVHGLGSLLMIDHLTADQARSAVQNFDANLS